MGPSKTAQALKKSAAQVKPKAKAAPKRLASVLDETKDAGETPDHYHTRDATKSEMFLLSYFCCYPHSYLLQFVQDLFSLLPPKMSLKIKELKH